MRKTQQVFVTNTRRRESVDSLAGLTKRIEQTMDGGAGTSVLPGSFGSQPCTNCLPECETYRITDLDTIIDSLSDVWGTVSGSQLVSSAGISAAITVQAKTTRLDSQTFQLPSAAQWVVDVWFDDLHADPGYHYGTSGDRLITTVAPLPTDVVVECVYFNKVV